MTVGAAVGWAVLSVVTFIVAMKTLGVGSSRRFQEKTGKNLSVTRVDRLATRSRVFTLREVLTKRHSVLKARFKCWNKRRENSVTTRRVVDLQD